MGVAGTRLEASTSAEVAYFSLQSWQSEFEHGIALAGFR